MTELYLQCLILSLLEVAKEKIRQIFPEFQNAKKQEVPGKNTAEKKLFGNTVRFYPQPVSDTNVT